MRRTEPLANTDPRRLVLEQLADLGQREPGVVAQAADEAQPLEIIRVVEAVGSLASGSRLEQPDLLVVANRTGRQPGFRGDFLDAEQSRRGFGGRAEHARILPDLTVYVKVQVSGDPQRPRRAG